MTEGIAAKDLPAGTLLGVNDWCRTGYGGPCPPGGKHRYFFKLYALDIALQEAVRHTGECALAQAAEKVRQSGVTAEIALLEVTGERIASVIDGEARRWPADLFVIGTHGRSGLSRLLLGSVAEGVVRGASVPVLLVRAE